jgi:hypothetical protein
VLVFVFQQTVFCPQISIRKELATQLAGFSVRRVQKFVAFPVLHLTGEHFTPAFKLKFECRKGGYSYEPENSSDKTGKGKYKGR